VVGLVEPARELTRMHVTAPSLAQHQTTEMIEMQVSS